MTTVDHTRDHALTAQGSQAARARAVAHLIEDNDLPTISNWSIDAELKALIGLIWAGRGESTEDQRNKVRAWARFLDAAVSETAAYGRIEVSTEGYAYGIPVRIIAQLRITEPKAVA